MISIRSAGPFLLATLAATAAAAAGTFQIDPVHSSVQFSVRHMMISNVKGQFHSFGGTIDYDGKDASKASVQVTVQTSSVDTGVDKRDGHLRSEDFLDVAKFPLMTFKSTKVDSTGEKTAKVTGDLTLHGVTKPVVIDAELVGMSKDPKGVSKAGFSGTATISRKDFGLRFNKLLETGGAMVGDDVKINLEVEAGEK